MPATPSEALRSTRHAIPGALPTHRTRRPVDGGQAMLRTSSPGPAMPSPAAAVGGAARAQQGERHECGL